MTAATVFYHHEPPEGWWAESPDFPSFFAAADSYEETRKLVKEALHSLSGEPHLGIRHLMARSEAASVAEGEVQERRTGYEADVDLVLT